MGVANGFSRSCGTNYSCVAPNPSPSQYKVLSKGLFNYSTLLRVKYTGCTNFEGEKLLVFLGDFTPNGDLDPHFSEGSDSPIARFKPDKEGHDAAMMFCRAMDMVKQSNGDEQP